MARKPGMHHELVLIDQSQLRQRQRERHASREQSLTRLPLELLNGLPQIPAHELGVPIDSVQGARHDVLLCRVDRPGEGFHPFRPSSRPRRRPKRCLHHFVSHPAKEEGIGLVKVLDRVTMQLFVRGYCTMIAAPVQCDVDGIPKRSHYARVPPMGWTSKVSRFNGANRKLMCPAPLGCITRIPRNWTPRLPRKSRSGKLGRIGNDKRARGL